MNNHHDPRFNTDTLRTYQGYSLQVFASGRIKLSFHITHINRIEYYCDCPKRHREAYNRQKTRSAPILPKHFELTDRILKDAPYSLIFRVHLKADNNATADNAHIVIDTDACLCHVILEQLHHQWELPSRAVQNLLSRTGPRVGGASCFNEYMPSYDHDWDDTMFQLSDYTNGFRHPNHRLNTLDSSNDDPLYTF